MNSVHSPISFIMKISDRYRHTHILKMSSCRFLVINGALSQTNEVPPVASFLETHPGAYTTTRTHRSGSCILFWERHLSRLTESVRILSESKPEFLYGRGYSMVLDSGALLDVRSRVNDSMKGVVQNLMEKRKGAEEMALTTLVSGEGEGEGEGEGLDVYVHIGMYVPFVFGGRDNAAHLAVAGRGRDVALAKFSQWVSIRKSLEDMRPLLANELLLSNDGDQILEGCLTNFFVVCRKENVAALQDGYPIEVQTAPLSDGVLPGVIRQIVIEVCLTRGIPCREVAPHWSERELWQEAFVTNSLRIVQHVETIRVPSSWELLQQKTWKEVNWEEKCFEEGPGVVTSEIQKEIMKRAEIEGYSAGDFN